MERQFDGVADMPDLHGKVVVVTGGRVGFALVKRLAQKGAKVYFTTQSSSIAEATKETLVYDPSITPDNVDCLVMDPMDPITVSHAIHILKTKERKVDILINNAAVSTGSTELVAGGYEQRMAENHMGPFLLVDCMLPLLKNATKDEEADVRVISLSSTTQTAMLPNKFNFQFSSKSGLSEPVTQSPWLWRHVGRSLFGFDMIRYAVSKAAVVLFIKELQRRLEEQGLPILCMAVHPGEVATESLLELNSFPLKTIARMSFLTAEQGDELRQGQGFLLVQLQTKILDLGTSSSTDIIEVSLVNLEANKAWFGATRPVYDLYLSRDKIADEAEPD